MKLNFIETIKRALTPSDRKAASVFYWPAWRQGQPLWHVVDYKSYVTEGFNQNTLIYSSIMYKVRAMTSAPLRAWTGDVNSPERLPPDNPLAQLVARPNPHQSFVEFQGQNIVYLNVSGNSYIWMDRGPEETGLPEAMFALRPDRVFIVPGVVDGKHTVVGYVYVPEGRSAFEQMGPADRRRAFTEGRAVPIAPEDLLHVKFPNPSDPLEGLGYGMSPISPAARSTDVDNAVTHFLQLFFRNGVMIPGVFSSDQRLTDQTVARIKRRFKEMYGGYERWAEEVGVLEAGTTYQRIGLTFDEMGFEDLDARNESRIISPFGVPPILIGAKIGLDRCLPGTAAISTPEGIKHIAEIRPGDVVWSVHKGALERKVVTWQGKTGVKKVYEVKTKNRTLVASANHPVMVYKKGRSNCANHLRGGSLEWKAVENLTIGDWVVQPKRYPSSASREIPGFGSTSHEMMQFLGAIIGDGTVYADGQVSMAMPPQDRCYEGYIKLATKLFTNYGTRKSVRYTTECLVCGARIEGISQSRLDGNHGKFCNKKCKAEGMSEFYRWAPVIIDQDHPKEKPVKITERPRAFTFKAKGWTDKLIEWGFGGRAHTKRVPDWVFHLSDDLKLAFIAGVVDTDGHIDRRGCLTITLCSRRLVEDLRELLISCGIQGCNIREQILSPDVLPQPGIQDEYRNYSFVCSSAVQVSTIPFTDRMYRERVNANQHRNKSDGKFQKAQKVGLSANLGLYAIKSIGEVGDETVYDITVQNSHNFIADGILVHNSTYSNYEQARRAFWDDTMVPENFLYEEDYKHFLSVPEEGWFVAYDYSQVPAFQELRDNERTQFRDAFIAGAITRNEYRTRLGLFAIDEGDVYVISPQLIERPAMFQLGEGTTAQGQIEAETDDRKTVKKSTFTIQD